MDHRGLFIAARILVPIVFVGLGLTLAKPGGGIWA